VRPDEFHIGLEFYTTTGRWRCTDVGTRTVIAIRLNAPDESWYIGPSYAVAESVFDEDDYDGMSLDPEEVGFDPATAVPFVPVVMERPHSERLRSSDHETRRRGGFASADHRYAIVIFWSEPDRAFVAEVPELAGCATNGSTYRDALDAAEVAIREWIEAGTELGRDITPPRGRLPLRIG
jgi:predicted RNase H-like HicB family nuclease